MQPKHGKIIETTTFSNDEVVAIKRALVINTKVAGVMDTLNAIGTALKNIGSSENHKISFEVQADHKTLQPTLVVQTYQIERKQ